MRIILSGPNSGLGLDSPEGKFQLGLLVASDAELADALNELLEVDFAVPVRVENLYHSLQRRD